MPNPKPSPPSPEHLFLESFAVVFQELTLHARAAGHARVQSYIATMLGLSNSTVSEWARGRHRGISLPMIARVADRIGVSIDDLFRGPNHLRERLQSVPLFQHGARPRATPLDAAELKEIEIGLDKVEADFRALRLRILHLLSEDVPS